MAGIYSQMVLAVGECLLSAVEKLRHVEGWMYG